MKVLAYEMLNNCTRNFSFFTNQNIYLTVPKCVRKIFEYKLAHHISCIKDKLYDCLYYLLLLMCI